MQPARLLERRILPGLNRPHHHLRPHPRHRKAVNPMGATSRNDRNNPYLIEGLAVKFHRSAAGVLWRWRTELILIAAVTWTCWRLTTLITLTWSLTVLAVPLITALAIPRSRRYLASHAWCTLSRHRLQRVCYETRMHTRAGRLPLIIWIRPTKVGERAWVLCRAGICADDFDAYKAEIAAACYARETRITRHRKWSQLVTLDIVRHDPLGTGHIVPSQIHAKTGRQAAPRGIPKAAA
jgi:hypothetical protein